MKLSIIIPIYNTEVYLERCVDSILNQSNIEEYDNRFEVLLINDGSPDNSQKIIDEYSNKYNFIRGYTKKNGGLSDARNFGLQKAEGSHIWYLDSDDWIDGDSFNIIFNEFNINKNLDILEFDIYGAMDVGGNIKLSKNKFYNSIKTGVLSGAEALESFGYIIGVCFKIIRKSLFEDSNLMFPLNEYNEDNIISLKLMIKCGQYKKINIPLYYYYSRSDSITNTRSMAHLKKYYSDILNNLIKVEEIIKSYNKSIDMKKVREMQSFYTTNLLLGVLKTKNKEMINEYISTLGKIGLYPIKPYKYHNSGISRNAFIFFVNRQFTLNIFKTLI